MTSINPKNVNLNNIRQNEADIALNPITSLYQKNNYAMDKGNLLNQEGLNNNLNYNRNLNINLFHVLWLHVHRMFPDGVLGIAIP